MVALPLPGVVANPLRGDRRGLYAWQPVLEVIMKNFRLYKPGWWIVHALAIALFFWLGHAVRFV